MQTKQHEQVTDEQISTDFAAGVFTHNGVEYNIKGYAFVMFRRNADGSDDTTKNEHGSNVHSFCKLTPHQMGIVVHTIHNQVAEMLELQEWDDVGDFINTAGVPPFQVTPLRIFDASDDGNELPSNVRPDSEPSYPH